MLESRKKVMVYDIFFVLKDYRMTITDFTLNNIWEWVSV